MKKDLFVDLDHTLIRPKSGQTFPQSADDWEFMPNVLETLYFWHGRNILEPQALVIVTNQGGVAAGFQTKADVEVRLADIVHELRASLRGGEDDIRVYVSYDNDYQRKPMPGLAFRAALDMGLDLPNSWMVGDMQSDFEFSRNAGLKGFSWAETFFNWKAAPTLAPLNVREG
jgi:histidinol-phosphate phosphatase family protein